jgi:capping protein beta
MEDVLDSMLDLMRRLPPTRVEENADILTSVAPDYADDFLGSIDQPLKLKIDKHTGREYLACDYNRDGDSYRYVASQLLRTDQSPSTDHPGLMSMTRQ